MTIASGSKTCDGALPPRQHPTSMLCACMEVFVSHLGDKGVCRSILYFATRVLAKPTRVLLQSSCGEQRSFRGVPASVAALTDRAISYDTVYVDAKPRLADGHERGSGIYYSPLARYERNRYVSMRFYPDDLCVSNARLLEEIEGLFGEVLPQYAYAFCWPSNRYPSWYISDTRINTRGTPNYSPSLSGWRDWTTSHYESGHLLRDVYESNYLSEPWTRVRVGDRSLAEWIASDRSRGTLTEPYAGTLKWAVPSASINDLRSELLGKKAIYNKLFVRPWSFPDHLPHRDPIPPGAVSADDYPQWLPWLT